MEQRIVVNGILSNANGLVLLAKRAANKKIAPGKYHLPGGHIEFGETPEEAIVREFAEEFELDVEVHELVYAFSYVHDDIHTIGLSYRLSSHDDLSDITFDETDTEAIAWVGKSSIGQYLAGDDHNYTNLMVYFG